MAQVGAEVLLFLSAEEVVSTDLLSKSDPFAVISVDGEVVATTKALKDTSNPVWADPVPVFFKFERLQKVAIAVWDHDKHNEHDLIGQCNFTLGGLMGARGRRIQLQLAKPDAIRSHRGTLIIQAEQGAATGAGSIQFQFSATKLDSKDWGGLGRSDPFFVISRPLSNGTDIVPCYQSEYIKNNNNPTWKKCEISLSTLCKGDLNQKLQITVYDHDDGDKRDLIGTCNLSVKEIIGMSKGFAGKSVPLIHPPTRHKYKKSSYRNSGLLHCAFAKLKKSSTASLLEYISGGLEINTIFAVDYTASNGDPRHPRSLHYLFTGGQLNEYQNALVGVGSIMQEYDHDKNFPCFGFGAQIDGMVSHCFALNGNARHPVCSGIQGVLGAYDSSFAFASLSGPTYFTPVIQAARNLAHETEMSQQRQKYTVLLILTDGVITDFDSTVSAIVEASQEPLSIIIVGVGKADFGKMEHLDADAKTLVDSRGRRAARDIVQFVPFSKCAYDGAELARLTLAELPRQIVEYFESRGIKPNPPLISPNSSAVMVQKSSEAQQPQRGSMLEETARKGKDLFTRAYRM